MSIYTHYTIEATTRLGEVYVWNPLTDEYEYQDGDKSSDIRAYKEDAAIDELGHAVAAANPDEFMMVSLLRVTELSDGTSDVSVVKLKHLYR